MEEWQKEVLKAQNIIAPYAGNYWNENYRLDETYYWWNIPRWMYKQRENGERVNNVLNVGCGVGTLSVLAQELFNCKSYAVDMVSGIPPEILEEYNIDYRQMDIELEDFPKEWPNKFRYIILTEVLEHLWFNPTVTLTKLQKYLTPNGKIFISTPDACSWGRIVDYYHHVGEMPFSGEKPDVDEHIYQYTIGELLRIIDESGLVVDEIEYVLPPFWQKHINAVLSKKEGRI